MKKLTSTEFGGLVLAIVFFAAGIVFLAWPRGRVALHPIDGVYGPGGTDIELVSESGSRIYGVLSLGLGAGVGALALYRPKSRA
jgi:hypothetical protein